ncbi:MAG: 5'-methylthioadenosine/S-adenosylhomocysteine nucleosidase [Mycoplasma sp.]
MLGIIIAMETECLNLVKTCFKDTFIHSIQGNKFYVVKTVSGETAVITFCGIGKVNAAAITSLMINSFNISSCLNIGSAGIVDGIDVLDVLIVDKTYYSDVDVTAFGYEMGQVPKMPKKYETNNNLNQLATELLNVSDYKIFLGNCLTSDSFINMGNISKYNIEKTSTPTVIDMECAAIAQTCLLFKVPLLSVKIGIDKLYSPNKNEDQFNSNLGKVQLIIDDITSNLINALTFKLKTQNTK